MNMSGVNIGDVIRDTASAQALARPKASIAEVAGEFEQMFINQMMQPMFENMEGDSLAGDPQTDDIYQSWMVEQYSKLISASGGVGLADHVQKAMLSLQEVKS